MIENSKPLSMAEATEYIKNSQKGTEMLSFIKKFVKISPKKAKELREKLIGLELMKMKNEDIVKIIDLMPETAEELNKIFVGISLDEDEKSKILEIIKEFR